jgi:hypothetical protein
MTQNAYIRPKSLYTIILYIREGIWVISCHDCYRPLTFDVRMSLNVFRTPILFSQALEFRDYGMDLCLEVYIFEPFIHILQHFVLQLSHSTNFCF